MVQDDKQAEEADKVGEPGTLEQIVWVALGMIFACGVVAAEIAKVMR